MGNLGKHKEWSGLVACEWWVKKEWVAYATKDTKMGIRKLSVIEKVCWIV